MVNQIYIHCDSTKAFLMCVVVPNPYILQAWASKQSELNAISTDAAALCAHPAARAFLQRELARIGKRDGLQTFEVPAVVLLETVGFTVENGRLTVSMKTNRPNLKREYAGPLEALAAEMAASAAFGSVVSPSKDALAATLMELVGTAAGDAAVPETLGGFHGSVLDRLGNDSLSAMRFFNLVRS